MKLGAQIFTLRDFTKTDRDFARTLERVAKMGYTTVQISTISPDITPQRIRQLCDQNGLQIVLTHRNIERIITDTEKVIEEHQVMDCPYIGIGMLQEPYRCKEWIRYFCDDFRKPAEKIAAAGQLLMYHNHAIEFARTLGAKDTYLIHMSHQAGLHTEIASQLPPHIHVAYDGLEINL